MNNSLLFLLVFLASGTAGNYTGSAAKLFVIELSGRFSNEQSLQNLKEEGYLTNQDLVKVEVYPLNNIPALNSDFTLYFEDWKAEQLILQQILAVKGEGDIFEVQPYDFVHPESFVPGTFNISSLESLTLNDLTFREECKSIFVRTGETTLVADWAFRTNTKGSVVRIMVTSNCQTWTSFVNNKELLVSKSKIPYTNLKVENFDVPASIMPDFEMYKSLCNY